MEKEKATGDVSTTKPPRKPRRHTAYRDSDVYLCGKRKKNPRPASGSRSVEICPICDAFEHDEFPIEWAAR